VATTYDPDRERRRLEAERERARKAAERQRRAEESARKAAYVAGRKAEAERVNAQLEARVEELSTFLVRGLPATVKPSLSQLRRVPTLPRLSLGALAAPAPEPEWSRFAPAPANWWRRTFAAPAVDEEERRALAAYNAALHDRATREQTRQRKVEELKRHHQAECERLQEAADRANAELDALNARATARDKEAVEQFSSRILTCVPRPSGFPTATQVTFDPRAEHLVVELELPTPDCVPSVKSVRYIQARDELLETARPPRDQADIYRSIVSQLCLLVLRALFNADSSLRQLSLNGRVRHTNPATGQHERPHIISVVVEREQFGSLVLDRVRASDCLKYLKALISPHPYELEPVEPLVDFDRSRLAFVEGLDMVSTLDARPDLMALSPTGFEHLIRQLFEADPTIESVESLVTRESNDGGIDGVIYVKQPLGRSMTVVQVKQYARSRSLGPAHVRELIGAMHEAKAGNGLLVTTSTFTTTAITNAREFGRIQLIDGNNLVHLFKEHLGKDVLIGDRIRGR
jgi:restriction system protein